MLTFDRLPVDQLLGTRRYAVDGELLAAWEGFLPPETADAPLPPGLAVALSMRAYIEVTAPRPPGNVHAGQTYRLGRPLRRGDEADVAVRCLGKEERKGRLWARFGTDLRAGGDAVLLGEMTMIWARRP